MDQVERALLVVSGDAKSSNLVADPRVRLILKSYHSLIDTDDTQQQHAYFTLVHVLPRNLSCHICHAFPPLCRLGCENIFALLQACVLLQGA